MIQKMLHSLPSMKTGGSGVAMLDLAQSKPFLLIAKLKNTTLCLLSIERSMHNLIELLFFFFLSKEVNACLLKLLFQRKEFMI